MTSSWRRAILKQVCADVLLVTVMMTASGCSFSFKPASYGPPQSLMMTAARSNLTPQQLKDAVIQQATARCAATQQTIRVFSVREGLGDLEDFSDQALAVRNLEIQAAHANVTVQVKYRCVAR